jgi:DNA replication protein DnaC
MSRKTLRHPGARSDCRLCGGDGYTVVRAGEMAVGQLCSCVSRCPLCAGTGLVAVGPEQRAPRRRCVCQSVAGLLRRFDDIRIPAKHADSTRGSFHPTSPLQVAVLMAVTKVLEDYERARDNRGLVLWGGVGRGKTHLLVALLRELVLRHGVSARFVEFSHLLAELKAGFDSGRGAAELLDPLVAVDVLAIDELGKGRNTEFEGTVLDELVSRRYNAMRPILATTNYAPSAATGRAVANAAEAQLGTAPLPSLADRVGDRVFSRLLETCDFVEVRGDDYRVQTAQKRRPRTVPPAV